MENDLISRKALMDTLQNHFGQDLAYLGEDLQYCQEAVQFAPSIEAEPVRHGRWTWITEDIYRCENCGERVHVKEVMGKPDWDYCPNCGAKMDGGAEDD